MRKFFRNTFSCCAKPLKKAQQENGSSNSMTYLLPTSQPSPQTSTQSNPQPSSNIIGSAGQLNLNDTTQTIDQTNPINPFPTPETTPEAKTPFSNSSENINNLLTKKSTSAENLNQKNNSNNKTQEKEFWEKIYKESSKEEILNYELFAQHIKNDLTPEEFEIKKSKFPKSISCMSRIDVPQVPPTEYRKEILKQLNYVSF